MKFTRGAVDISKPGVDQELGLVLSGDLFEGNWVGNLEGEGPRDGDPLDNSEGTRVEKNRHI